MFPIAQTIRCPNCGSPAERNYLPGEQMTRTQCAHCDYLMVMQTYTGRVVEAYAPGYYAHRKVG